MPRPAPLCVRDTRAAEMLDLPPARFRALVAEGILPPPVSIGGMERWRVADLDAILTGQKLDAIEW